MTDLRSVKTRDKLTARPEPYWYPLAAGLHLGYRPSASGKAGGWIARHRDADNGKRTLRALGDFADLSAGSRFDAAAASAREWAGVLDQGGSADDVTVRQACERYAESDKEVQRRFEQYVYQDPIANLRLRRLREHHLLEWRARLTELPASVSRSKTLPKVTRTRAPQTVDRDMVPFKAALNAALNRGEVGNALAWKNALKPSGAHGKREIYLDRDQRRALLDHLPPDAAAFARALCLLPLRPGALAKVVVGDFDPRVAELHVRNDKANAGRLVPLSESALALFKAQARNKLPGAPLFMRADGVAWNKDSWKLPVKEGVRAAGLPADATLYSLRHAVITDLIVGGLDFLTVAKMAGTSVRMIEVTYGHLRAAHAAAALQGLAL